MSYIINVKTIIRTVKIPYDELDHENESTHDIRT